jgi:hypothetical protein
MTKKMDAGLRGAADLEAVRAGIVLAQVTREGLRLRAAGGRGSVRGTNAAPSVMVIEG